MDRQLAERLNALTKQNAVLESARAAYLLKEAERKHFEATMINDQFGKSHAEKTILAQARPEWAAFAKELAALENTYEFEKLKFGILEKAWMSEQATYKLEDGLIRKQA